MKVDLNEEELRFLVTAMERLTIDLKSGSKESKIKKKAFKKSKALFIKLKEGLDT